MIQETEFTYCPHCATHFGPLKTNVFVCPNCNLHYYINPKPTNAIALENEKGEILFVVRALDPHKGMLDLPGGFLDVNETLEESLQREVKEELGIHISQFSYVSSFHDEYEHGKISSRCICMLFTGKLPPDTAIHVGDDASGYIFIPKDKIPYDQMAFEGMKTALRKILHCL